MFLYVNVAKNAHTELAQVNVFEKKYTCMNKLHGMWELINYVPI